MSEVTIKNTKQEILDALKAMKSQLAEKGNTNYSPAEEAKAITKKEVLGKVNEFESEFDATLLKNGLAQVVDKIDTVLAEYREIEKAIAIKKEEIQDLYGIEAESTKIFDLVNTHKSIMEDLKIKKDTELKALELKIDEANKTYLENMKKIKDERKKDEEEYEYNFARSKKLRADEFEDECKVAQDNFDEELYAKYQILSEKENDLVAKEKELHSQVEYIEKLSEQVASFEALKSMAVEEAVTKTKESATKGFTFQKTIMEKDYQGKLALLESQLQNSESIIFSLKQSNDQLSKKLEDSYAKIESLAGKVVEASSDSRLVASLQDSLKEKRSDSK